MMLRRGGFGATLTKDLTAIQDGYREESRLLILEEWSKQPGAAATSTT